MTTDDAAHLVVVDYHEDTERKRAEYLLDNWDEGRVESVRGLTRIVHDADIDDVYDALVAKVPEDRITTYELTPVNREVSTSDAVLDFGLDTDPQRIEWAMESLLNKRKAVDEPDENTYAVYSKKGRATVRYEITPRDGGGDLRIEIEGYGEAAEFLRDYFEEELAYML
jgi:hypothetical protein